MAGLLDMFPSDLNDPRAQFNLALAAGLLGGRGNFGQVFGQALPGAMGAYNQAQESAQQRAMRQLQVDQLKRKMEQERRDRDLLTKFASPQYPIGATSMRPETMTPLPFDPLAVLREGGSPEAAQTLAGLRAPKAPIKVGTEDTLLDPTTMKPVYQGSGKQSDFERALARVFPPGTPQYQKAMQDWITKQSTHQPATNVQVNTDKSLFGEIAKIVGQDVAGARSAAMAAPQTIATIDNVLSALDSGKVIAGPGAKARIAMAQIGRMIGYGANDADALVNTRRVIQGAAQLVLESRQALKGQGQISDYEGKLLAKANSADVDEMSVPEIREVMLIIRKKQQYLIEGHNKNVENIRRSPSAGGLLPFFSPVNVPAPYTTPTPPLSSQNPAVDALVQKYAQ